MLREAASLIRSLPADGVWGNVTVAQAATMEADASNLLSQLMVQLKQPDKQDQGGWWYTLYPRRTNASSSAIPVEVRMLHDFLYVGQTIGSELSAKNQALMVDFFLRELRTPLFVRAMSQFDPSANVTGSRRADHNQCAVAFCSMLVHVVMIVFHTIKLKFVSVIDKNRLSGYTARQITGISVAFSSAGYYSSVLCCCSSEPLLSLLFCLRF